MKYIFIVHSPITYLAALGVIYKEKFNFSDVLIISETFGLNNEPIPILKLSKYNNKGKLRSLFRSAIRKKLYKLIHQKIGNKSFIAFIPVFHYIDRFLVLHKNCYGFHFIEEGLSAYYSAFNIKQHVVIPDGNILYSNNILKRVKETVLQTIYVCKGYTGKLNAIPTFYLAYANDKNINFYGFNSSAHQYALNKKIISIGDIAEHFDFKSSLNLKDCYIWINDPDLQISLDCSIDEYLNIIDKGYIEFLKSKNVSFSYLRFHYRDTIQQKQIITDFFINKGIKVVIIPNSIILEIELIKANNICLFGFYSSLLLYGSILGCKSYSIINYHEYLKTNPINDQIGSFWGFVQKL